VAWTAVERHHRQPGVRPIHGEDVNGEIFVGNLAWSTTEEELAHLFHPYGQLASVRILTDRETGRSRGFGFVEMPDRTEAQAAMDGLNGTLLGGRTLTISEARQREDRGRPHLHQAIA
jgi:RNA recognition motif-containing protein